MVPISEKEFSDIFVEGNIYGNYRNKYIAERKIPANHVFHDYIYVSEKDRFEHTFEKPHQPLFYTDICLTLDNKEVGFLIPPLNVAIDYKNWEDTKLRTLYEVGLISDTVFIDSLVYRLNHVYPKVSFREPIKEDISKLSKKRKK